MKTIYIEGMQCEHCKARVEKVLKELKGVTKVDVSLEDKNAIIEADVSLDNAIIKEAIEDIGFEVTNIE